MPPVKRITDLSDYTTVLPYDSELFGVYQPLLGWKSKRIEDRFKKGLERDKPLLLEKLKNSFAGVANISLKDNRSLVIDIQQGVLKGGTLNKFDSIVLQQVAMKLPTYDKYTTAVWAEVLKPEFINTILKKEVVSVYSAAYDDFIAPDKTGFNTANLRRAANVEQPSVDKRVAAFEAQLKYESSIAGALAYLVKARQFNVLEEIFYDTIDTGSKASALLKNVAATNPIDAYLDLEHLNPRDKDQLNSVVLSPISVVHLFRQYFFELDTFLGTPVSHVWLSPGSSVELIEVHTRTERVEKTLENTLDILTKSELSTTDQEEISDAVKENNKQDIKFGASVTASYSSITATSSFDYNNSQEMSREATHRKMRQQTEKLSSEIRKNFKSTFKTVTETTDISSTKHTMANTTQELINYELRRKMRQVGVQVQDIGTFLCWQTYVDDPGKELGLSKLVHIAKPVDLDGIPHPEEIPLLQNFKEERIVTVPFVSVLNDADNEDEVYRDGVEVDDSEWFGSLEKIQADFEQEFVSPKANYSLSNVEFDPQGKPLEVSRKGAITNTEGKARFTLHLDSADFQGQNSVQVKVTLHWSPSDAANKDIRDKNAANLATFKAREKAEFEKAYVETVKERIDIASKIRTRNSDELREEERIVVYRRLIQDMLLNGVSLPDDRTRHVIAEVINSIFDIDKMLYFVSPEWWRPRLHRSKQQIYPKPPVSAVANTALTNKMAISTVLQNGLINVVSQADVSAAPSSALNSSVVGWGGIDDAQRDNYYITEDSEPAKLGSSLGWLLQLDGDNMRNAFLNAPWVKAVIPIRPGKEEAAINWLKGVEGMNGITDDVIYHATNPNEKDINGNPLEGQKMIDVLMDLAKKIKKKYQEGIELGKYPKQDEVSDPDLVDEENTVTATPIDRVYEHGFFPLENSFRANVGKNYEIFDQWIEILPTDQIVPVEVKYDPRTGRQVVEE